MNKYQNNKLQTRKHITKKNSIHKYTHICYKVNKKLIKTVKYSINWSKNK